MSDRPHHPPSHPVARRRRLAATAALAMTAVLAPATDVSTAGAAPPSAASPAGAAPRAAEISTGALDRLVQRLRTDGKAVAVTAQLRRGARTWTFDAGRARRAPARTVQPGSSFRAASVTKQLVAVLALQLVEKGTWTLDTTIGDVDPGLWPGREAITVRQLLSHTSGMPDHLGAVVAEATTGRKFVRAISRRSTDQEIIALGRRLPWAAEPGTFSYSNTGYVVVGQMLERATGTSVRRLVERRILRPVGMTDSAFALRKSSPRPGLHEYARWPGRTLDLRSFEPSLFSSAGALVSTARDLNEFRRALEAGDLIGERWVRVMQHPLTDQGYGLGTYRLPSPCSSGPRWVHGHDGGSFGTLTFSVGLGGNRQLTIAMTGRGYTEDTVTSQSRLLQKFAYTALAATCADDRKDRREDRRPGGAPEWPQLLDVVAARTPAS